MIAVTEYTDAAQMRADYAARRARLYAQEPVALVPLAPVAAPAEPVPTPQAFAVQPAPKAKVGRPVWRGNKPWTQEELERLESLLTITQSSRVVGRMMGRTPMAVVVRANRHGVFFTDKREDNSTWSEADHERETDPSLSEIIKETANRHGIKVRALLGLSRSQPEVRARQEAMWLCARDTNCSLPKIGRAFRRDHTTVLHSIRTVNDRTGENVRLMGSAKKRRLQNRDWCRIYRASQGATP